MGPIFTAIFYRNSWEPFVKIAQLEIIYFRSLQNKRSCGMTAASGSPKLKWVVFHKFTWATSSLFCQSCYCCCIKGKAWTWTSEMHTEFIPGRSHANFYLKCILLRRGFLTLREISSFLKRLTNTYSENESKWKNSKTE